MKNPFKKYICIKQHNLKDCGAACLAQRIDIPLRLGYYEHVINLPMNFFGTRN